MKDAILKSNRIFQNLNWNRKLAILNCVIFFGSMVIGNLAEQFRFDTNLRWIYQSGKLIALLLFFGSLIWSIINSFLILNDSNFSWKYRLTWVSISLIPMFYFGIRIIIRMMH